MTRLLVALAPAALPALATGMRLIEDGSTRRQMDEDRLPRRALLVAMVAVILLVVVGLLVAKGLLDMSKLQDCAATGRRDC